MTDTYNPTTMPAKQRPTAPIRVLLGKVGLDGHNRGVHVVAQALRDAGMEVIYTGIRQTPEKVARAALEEDVDVIGLSSLSGAHMALFKKTVELVKKNKLKAALVCGGVIPDDDIPKLKKLGFKAVFTPGTSLVEIVEMVQGAAGRPAKRRGAHV